MKILHVIDSAGLYGAEAILLLLMEWQAKMGNQPALLSLGNKFSSPKNIEIESQRRGLETHTLRFRNGLNFWGRTQILQKANSLGTQIIHSHGYKSDIFLGMLPSCIRKIPVVATIHGWTSIHFFSKIWLYEALDAVALRNFDAVVAVTSNPSHSSMLKLFGVKPTVIKNGLTKLRFGKGEFEREFPSVAHKLRGHFKILSVGRLSEEKGFDTLIQAIDRLKKMSQNICLVIFGDGDQKFYLQKLIESKALKENVFLLGYRKDVFRYMPDFDVFVLPSRTEGLPITLLEAMQASIPVVATCVGEIPKVLGEGQLGELVYPDDPQGLASAIVKTCENIEQAKERATIAQAKILEEYSVNKMVRSYMTLYKAIMDKRQVLNCRSSHTY